MDFSRDYQVIAPVPGDGAQSFRARRNSTGEEVTVHVLTGGKTPGNEAFLTRLRRLPPMSQAKLVQVREEQGSTLVVTPAPPHLSLGEWLDSEEKNAQAAPGEFTRLFQTPPRAPVNEPAPPAPAAPPPSAAAGPGEFTRLFQTGAKPAEPAESATPPPPAREPGEFTRQFQSPAPAPPSIRKQPDNVGEPPASQPGEFTRFFRGGQPEKPPAPAFPPPPPFTPAAAPPPPPAPAPPTSSEGEFTRIFGRPAPESKASPAFSAAPAAPPAFAAPPAVPAAVPTAPAGPSEYTQMIGRPATVSAAPPPMPAAPPAPAMQAPAALQPPVLAKPQVPAAPPAPSLNWVLIAIVGLLCFLAGGLVVFLLMKH